MLYQIDQVKNNGKSLLHTAAGYDISVKIALIFQRNVRKK